MSHQYATVGDTVYFYFAANDTSGSGGDGATPLYDVREAGAAASAIPLLSGTPTLLTHANYPAGLHEVAVAATGGNGFAADDMFAVFCTIAIDSQNPSGFIGSCKLTPVATEAKQDIIDTNVDTLLTRIVGTLAAGTHNPATAAQIAVLSDWINGGRLDLILDIIAADTTTDIPALIAALNDVAATDIVSAGAITTLTGAVVNVDLVDTTTTNTDMVTEPPTAVQNRQEMDSNSTQLAAIVADTNELQTDWANGGRLDLILDAVLAMLDDPRGEPAQGAPAVNPDAMTKIDYLYKAWRNKIEQTATTLSIYDDAGTTVDHKATVADDTATATKGEIGAGP